MITHVIPHNARYLPTITTFSAVFNTVSSGVYDFNSPGNKSVVVLSPMDTNSIYLIGGMQSGANIAQEEFLAAIRTTPLLTLRKQQNNEIVYASKIPLVLFSQDKDITAFVHSNKGNDALVADLTGVLAQTQYLLGISPVSIYITFDIFAMDSRDFNESFRGVSTDSLYTPVRK